MKYIFRHVANLNEIQSCYDIAMERMHWMDDVGISQWNVTRYDLRYPIEYYRSISNNLFVLTNVFNEIVCVAALFEFDERWGEDFTQAFYVHHLASKINEPHVGSIFLEKAEEFARAMGKEYMRLDSAIGNVKLETYYSDRGYVSYGTCEDGEYHGILRQKKLKENKE